MNEQFSAFLDNEATRDETDSVVNELLRDESMRRSWSRQHWVREVLRTSASETSVSLDMAFSERVMQAVREDEHADVEPDVDAPADADNVVPMPRPRQRQRWRTVAGFAVAASAAGFALFVVEPMLTAQEGPLESVETARAAPQASESTLADTTMVATTGVDDVSRLETNQTVSSDSIRGVDTGGQLTPTAMTQQWKVSNQVLANRLNSFLAEHNGMARGYGLGATTPGYIRVATYGQASAR